MSYFTKTYILLPFLFLCNCIFFYFLNFLVRDSFVATRLWEAILKALFTSWLVNNASDLLVNQSNEIDPSKVSEPFCRECKITGPSALSAIFAT